eukprot:169584_1
MYYLHLFFINIILSEAQILSNWTSGTNTNRLPAPRSSQVIGYNAPDDTVWMLGGFTATIGYDNAVWSFDLTMQQFTIHTPLTYTIHCGSQTYTQINNIIYFNLDGNIGTFDMDTEINEYPSSKIPSMSYYTESGCLTTDGKHLFLLGGSDWNAYFQIFDTFTNLWSIGPPMTPTGRYRTTCHVIDDFLYVFGGTYPDDNTFLDTVIKIYIANMQNINSYSWNTISDTLITPTGYQRSVRFGNLIYLIGGTIAGPTYINDVYVLNPISDTILTVPPMNNIRSSAASIVADARIYVFGGYDNTGTDRVTNSWEVTNIMPSSAPTPAPTNNPTFSPSAAPSYAPTIYQVQWSINAIWSSSFLSILIDIENDNNGFDEYNEIILYESYLRDECKNLFEDFTLDLIGYNAVCSWLYNENNNLMISLPANAKINLTNSLSGIIFKKNAFGYFVRYDNFNRLYNLPMNVTINEITVPAIKLLPNIIVSIPSQIGICDDLILDARSTTNTGGRSAEYKWSTDNNTYTTNNNVLLVDGTFFTPETYIHINVTVCTWYGASNSLNNMIVYKSNKITPIVQLYGPNTYSSSNNNYLNNKIELRMSLISINNQCDDVNYNIDISTMQYTLTWMVQIMETLTQSNITNNKISLLESFLMEQSNKDVIMIDIDNYLLAGYSYIFTVYFECINDNINCNVSAS